VPFRKTNTDARPFSDSVISPNFFCVTFVIGAVWTVFALSFALYEHAAASKPADLAPYVSITVAVPVAGYVALRISSGALMTPGAAKSWARGELGSIPAILRVTFVP
jgi:hypothetical protein